MLQAVLVVFVAFRIGLLTDHAPTVQPHSQLVARAKMVNELVEREQPAACITFAATEFLRRTDEDWAWPGAAFVPFR